MKIKLKTSNILIILIFIVVIFAGGYVYAYRVTLSAYKTLIVDFGYKKSEIHDLTFTSDNNKKELGLPEIPVKVGNGEYKLWFDTGCAIGICFTDVIENNIDYTVIKNTEAVNRDGSHRGSNKLVGIKAINIFGTEFKNIEATISDWSMISSQKFNGLVGLDYFKSKVITLDYLQHKIAISSNQINYSRLNPNKYVVLPLYKATTKGHEGLLFFEAEYNNKPVMVYLDTGKNHSYLYNPESTVSVGVDVKKAKTANIQLKVGSMDLTLNNIIEANNIKQEEGLPYANMIELNSDQIWKCNLMVTIDLIQQKIIFRKL